MNEQALSDTIIRVLQDIAPDIDTAQLNPNQSFRDQFELDSVDFLNVVLKLEQTFGVRIPEMDYPKLSSLKGCIDYLQTELNS